MTAWSIFTTFHFICNLRMGPLR